MSATVYILPVICRDRDAGPLWPDGGPRRSASLHVLAFWRDDRTEAAAGRRAAAFPRPAARFAPAGPPAGSVCFDPFDGGAA